MEEIANLIMNNGLGIVCVAYLIWFQSTTMKEMSNTLNNINTNLTTMNERINNLEDHFNKEKSGK